MFQNKIIVVTGGANGIGKCITEEFRKDGATVCVIDKAPGEHFVGDIADKAVLEAFAKEVTQKYGRVDVLVNNALPIMRGIDECSYEEFEYALAVGVTAPFYLTKLFAPFFGEGRLYYRREYLYRRWHDEAYGVSWRPWVDAKRIIVRSNWRTEAGDHMFGVRASRFEVHLCV